VRIVLDTNVLISAIFFGGLPGKVLAAWRQGKIHIILSPEIFREYQEVGKEIAQRYPAVDAQPILDLVRIYAQWIDPTPMELPLCDDPDDVKFILCAVQAKADFIISGDKHLLRLGGFENIKVLSPSVFMRQYLNQ